MNIAVSFQESDQSIAAAFQEDEKEFASSFGEVLSLAEGERQTAYQEGYAANQENLDLAVSRGAKSLRITGTTIGAYALSYCRNLVHLDAPNVVSVGARAIYECTNLVKLDFPKLTSIGTNGIYSNDNFKILVIRTGAVCSLGAASYIGSVCNVYVPRDLVERYKAAKSWKDIPDRIKALEDYTIDGTVTGQFDDEKALAEITG